MVFVWAGGKPGATEPPRLPLLVGGGQLGKELCPRAKHIDSGLLIFFPLFLPQGWRRDQVALELAILEFRKGPVHGGGVGRELGPKALASLRAFYAHFSGWERSHQV